MCEIINRFTDASSFGSSFESHSFADSSQIRIIDDVPQYYYTGSSYRDRLKNGITLEYMFELEDETREHILSNNIKDIVVKKKEDEDKDEDNNIQDTFSDTDELELNYDSDAEHKLSSKPKIHVHKPKLVIHKATTSTVKRNASKCAIIQTKIKEKVFENVDEKKEKETKQKELEKKKRRYKRSKKYTLGNAYKLTILADTLIADKLEDTHPDFDKHKEEDILQSLKRLWQYEQYDHDHSFNDLCDMDCREYRRRIILFGNTHNYNRDWSMDMTDFYDDHGDVRYAWYDGDY